MNKLLSLLVSFALLFTQLAPLGYATPRQQDNVSFENLKAPIKKAAISKTADMYLQDAGYVPCEGKGDGWYKEGKPLDYENMLDNKGNPHWKKCSYVLGAAWYFYGRANEYPEREQIRVTLMLQDMLIKMAETTRGKKMTKRYGILYNSLSSMRAEFCNGHCDSADTFTSATHDEGGTTLHLPKEKNKGNGEANCSTNGSNKGNEKKDDEANPDYMNAKEGQILRNFLRTDSKKAFDEEFYKQLAQFVEEGRDLTDLVEQTVRLFLDPKYLNGHSTPLPYPKLAAVLMAYSYQQQTNGDAGFERVWKYVIYPCNGKTGCSSVHDAALAAVEARELFTGFFAAKISGDPHFKKIIEQSFDGFSLARIGAINTSEAEMNQLIAQYNCLSNEEANKEILKKLAHKGADILGVSYKAIVEDEETSFSAASLAVAFAITKEEAMLLLTRSPQVLLVVGVALCLGRAYYDALKGETTFNADLDFDELMRLMTPVGVDIVFGIKDKMANPEAITQTKTRSVATVREAVGTKLEDNPNETCTYEPSKGYNAINGPANWTIGYAASRLEMGKNSLDERLFQRTMDNCGFNYGMVIESLPESTEDPICDDFVYDLQEIDLVKNKFISTKTQNTLYMKVRYKESLGFIPAPEIEILPSESTELIKIVARWLIDDSVNYLMDFFRILAGRDEINSKGFRRGNHERTQDKMGRLHFHYEELLTYQDAEMPKPNYYVCNHAVKYIPNWMNGIGDILDNFLNP